MSPTGPWTEFVLLTGPLVVVLLHISLSALQNKVQGRGVMGKRNASAHLTPLNMLLTTEADWLMHLLTNQMCRYAQKLFFIAWITCFRFESCVDMFSKIYQQYTEVVWSNLTNSILFHAQILQYILDMYLWIGVFSICCNVVPQVVFFNGINYIFVKQTICNLLMDLKRKKKNFY